MFSVTDLKQAVYCERIPYFDRCLPGLSVLKTPKMAEGAIQNETEEDRERRRSLRAYGLQRGARRYEVALASERLGLSGVLDMLITVEEDGAVVERIPVDYKNADPRPGGVAGWHGSEVWRNWRMQLAAYAVLVEDAWPDDPPVRRGFIYAIPVGRAFEVEMTDALRARARGLPERLRDMVEREIMPEAPDDRRRCSACEYRRFCNDI